MSDSKEYKRKLVGNRIRNEHQQAEKLKTQKGPTVKERLLAAYERIDKLLEFWKKNGLF